MAKFSTGLRNKMLDTGSAKSILALGPIKIYAGTVPADADAAIGSATLLTTLTVSSGATGLSLAASAAGGVIGKAAETWSGVNAATGTATFYRHVAVGDDGTASTTQDRIQGTCGLAGADMNLTSTGFTSGATHTHNGAYNISLPTL
jgi:hypothetical protein